MVPWSQGKRRFARVEAMTAQTADRILRAPLLRVTAGLWLRALSHAKATSDAATEAWCRGLGLPTRRDQIRRLQLLHRLESQVMDLTERHAEPEAH